MHETNEYIKFKSYSYVKYEVMHAKIIYSQTDRQTDKRMKDNRRQILSLEKEKEYSR